MDLEQIGWDNERARQFAAYAERDWRPGLVAVQHRDLYHLRTADGEVEAIVTGRFRHGAGSPADFPAVGDWVAYAPAAVDGAASIHAVLPRRSQFSRRAAGFVPYQQVIAANVDILFLVSGLDGNHSQRRIERYVTQAWESGAVPVVLLNKADLCEDPEGVAAQVRDAVLGVDVHAVSAETGAGLAALAPYLRPGRTVALVGSSGVGKSTLINRFLGEERLATRGVRAGDSRGRHTTSYRQLLSTVDGALLIDTPGMRELALWGEADDPGGQSFADIEALEEGCRFADCRHQTEPGCAVRAALTAGELDPARLANWDNMRRELARQARRAGQREVGRRHQDAGSKRLAKRSDRRAARRSLRGEGEA